MSEESVFVPELPVVDALSSATREERICCLNCGWWEDHGDTFGGCGWVQRDGLPYWADVAEPAAKAGVDGYYTHFDAGSGCAAHKGRT